MSTYEETLREHRRCSILRTLAETPSCVANESLLADVLRAFGLPSSRDQVRMELAWLQEQGLVKVENTAGIMVARITERGADVGMGAAIVPGVKRPTSRA